MCRRAMANLLPGYERRSDRLVKQHDFWAQLSSRGEHAVVNTVGWDGKHLAVCGQEPSWRAGVGHNCRTDGMHTLYALAVIRRHLRKHFMRFL